MCETFVNSGDLRFEMCEIFGNIGENIFGTAFLLASLHPYGGSECVKHFVILGSGVRNV